MPEIDENSLISDGAIPPSDFHNAIERINEVSEYELDTPANIVAKVIEAARNLLVDKETLSAAVAALQTGHLILQGPPGTGKSSLARALCRAFNVSDMSVTAHEDWTVYEMIGRLELKVHEDGKEQIEPVNGYFTESVVRCAGSIIRNFDDPNEPQAEWLVIDELNRSYMDKAFGELFTVLGTDESIAVTLPHQKIGNRELVVPRRYRIIGTINSVDRQFVNSLSQAIRRRFTFVTVDIPEKKPESTEWQLDGQDNSMANLELRLVVERAAKRIAKKYVSTHEELIEKTKEIKNELVEKCSPAIIELFELTQTLRFSKDQDETPYLPIGTAQLIDTVELFGTRYFAEQPDNNRVLALMDWAFAAKIVPSLDTGSATPDVIKTFANSLQVFSGPSRLELLRIVSSGLYHVE